MRPYLRVANVFEDRIDTRDVKEMDFNADEFERYRLRDGDVLLNEGQTPELLGRPAIYRGSPPDVCFTNSLIRFQAGPSVDPRWALAVFRHHMHSGRFARESRITTNIAHLSIGRLRGVEFPVPPIEEQRRIIDILEDHLSRLEAATAYLVAAEQRVARLRSAVLDEALKSACEHESQPIADLVAPGRKIAYGVLVPGPHLDTGVPLVRVGNIHDGFVDTNGLKRIDPAISGRFPRSVLTGGEVLLSVVGSIGRVGVAPSILAGSNVARAVAVLPFDERIDADFAALMLQAPSVTRLLNRSAHEVARKTLNLEDVRRVQIPVPDLRTQSLMVSEIGEQVSSARKLAAEAALHHVRTATLRRALLQAAFSGRLTG